MPTWWEISVQEIKATENLFHPIVLLHSKFDLASQRHHCLVTEFEPGPSVKFLPNFCIETGTHFSEADLDVSDIMSMVGIRSNVHEDSSKAVDGMLLAGVEVLRHVKLLRELDV